MKKHSNLFISTLAIFVISAFFVVIAITGSATGNPVPTLGLKNSTRIVPDADGFIQRWLILSPIRAGGDTQNAVQQTVKTEHFPNELTMVPSDGAKVTTSGGELTWYAVDTNEYNVSLYYFARLLNTTADSAMFWVVAIVNCPQDMPNVRLAIGSNSASVWWVNGKEVIGIYGDRCTVVDDGVSRRLTLKKGPNVIRGAIINRSGAADFCARILDSEGKPLKGYTISLNEDGQLK
jgi:hypothetical protein